MSATLSPNPKQQFFDVNGNPLSGGKLYSYQAGTSTPLVTYVDQAATSTNTNPIILDARGEANVWLGTAAYKLALYTALDVLVWTVDNISAADALALADLSQAAGSSLVGYLPGGAGALSTTVQAKLRESVSVVDFGADPTGVADSAAAFALAFAVGGRVIIPPGAYKTSGPSPLVSNTEVVGLGLPTITTTAADKHIISGVNLSNVSISGVAFVGLGSSTVPTVSVGGYAASSTGLVTFTGCMNVTVSDCSATAFYNGISTINCSDLDVTRNRITNWFVYGVLASLSDSFSIDHNHIVGCNQAGAANAYGISATGDEAGGDIQKACSISFNVISGIPSWDGIMTHDVSGLRVIGNDIRDVRIGIDIGHVIATNVVRDLIVALNYIESTATNTWGVTPAAHNGILVTGFDASNLVDGVTVIGNEVRNFFQTAGMVGAGGPSNITVQFVQRAVVTGNRVRNSGTVIGPAGIYIVGGNNGVVVSGNSLEGSMPAGGIRFAGVTSDSTTITGNAIKQTTTTDSAIRITGSTITSLAMADNAHNSTVPFVQSTSTLTMANTGTFTGTLTGCTTSPTAAIAWAINGSTVTLTFPALTATSNTTACTITGMPSWLYPFATTAVARIEAQNNSASVANVTASVAPGSGTITLALGGSTIGFTASGTKGTAVSTLTYTLA